MGTIRAAGSLAGSLSGTARTMIEHEDTGTMQSQLGTMVINSDDEDEEEGGTMKRRDETMQPAKPSFLEYFEQKEREANSHNDGEGRENNADNRKLPAEGDLEVVSTWTVEELRLRLASLDPQMEQEIEEIRQRYQAKRKPILDAIEAKKRRQQNF